MAGFRKLDPDMKRLVPGYLDRISVALGSGVRTRRRKQLQTVIAIIAICLVLLSTYHSSRLLPDYAIRQYLVRARYARPLSDVERVQHVAEVCGALCDVNAGTIERDAESNRTYRRVPMSRNRCRTLFNSPYMFAQLQGDVAPREIPSELLANFTMNHRIPVKLQYRNNVHRKQEQINQAEEPAPALVWSRELIESYVDLVRNGKLSGPFGRNRTSELYKLLRLINAKEGFTRALVIGSHSLKPSASAWIESALIAAGARETVTIDYTHIKCEHPRMQAYTPVNFAAHVLAHKMPHFDIIVSYNTVEHAGLGRYGDALDPWRDIVTIGMAWCVATRNAPLVLHVPTAKSDLLSFNLRRWYGPVRLPFLATNWKPEEISDSEAHTSSTSLHDVISKPMVFRKYN